MKMTAPNHTRARTFLALTTAFFLTGISQAETNKIGIIDMQRVWDKYYKTKQAQAQVDDQTADFEKRKKGMLDDYQKANREYAKLMESAKDQAVSSDERDKRKSAAEKKLLEIKEIEQDANLFQRTTDEQLKMQARRMTEVILRDIRDLVEAKAKAGGYTIVIDVAAKSAVGTAGDGPPGRCRTAQARPQLHRLPASHHRGGETLICRPRGLFRRSARHRRADQ